VIQQLAIHTSTDRRCSYRTSGVTNRNNLMYYKACKFRKKPWRRQHTYRNKSLEHKNLKDHLEICRRRHYILYTVQKHRHNDFHYSSIIWPTKFPGINLFTILL